MSIAPTGSAVLISTRSRPIEPLPSGIEIEPVLTSGVNNPIAMAVAPDGRLFYAEKGGFDDSDATETYVRVIVDGQLRATPWVTVTVRTYDYTGLLGITLDPNFETNRYAYLLLTPAAPQPLTVQVVRYTEDPATQTGQDPTVLFQAPLQDVRPLWHIGFHLQFGPDGMLYLALGDSQSSTLAQDLTSFSGKYHRMDRAGAAPTDNPFYNDPTVPIKTIYAYGFRNSYGFDFDPISGGLFASENGEGCDDELDRVVPGGNYDWGKYDNGLCPYPDSGVVPLVQWTPTIGTTAVAFYNDSTIPSWQGSLFMCDVNTGRLHRFTLDSSRTAVISEAIIDISESCTLSMAVDRDGSLLFSTFGAIYRLRVLSDLSSSYKVMRPVEPQSGGPVAFTIHLSNTGAGSTTYTVTDVLPPLFQPGPRPVIASRGTVVSGEVITWTGTLASGQFSDLTISGMVMPGIVSPTVFTNQATITTPDQVLIRSATAILNGKKVYLTLMRR